MRRSGLQLALVLLSIAGAKAQFGAAPGSPFAAGSNPQSIAVGDFNGDSKPDLAIASLAANSVTVLLGNGSGGFTPALTSPFAVGTAPQSIATGDFNGDGKLDLVTANSGANTITVLLGNGSGKFTTAAGSPFSVGATPVFVAVGDFNGDGHADIVTANSADNTVTILLGNGSGAFTPASGSPFAVGSSPQSVAVGDFNADGRQDLVIANSSANTVTVLLGNGVGGFAPASNSPFATGASPIFVAVRGLNILTANSSDNTVTELLGDGLGGFTQSLRSPIPVGAKPIAVATADFNGDGVPDLVTANSGGNSVTVLSGVFAVGTSPQSLAIADFNGDGKPDIAVVNSGDATVTILLNTLPALITTPSALTLYSGSGIPVSVSSSTAGSTYAVSSNKPWLVPTPASNATGGVTTVSVTANPAMLAGGSYTGIVRYSVANWFDAATTVTLNLALPSGTLQPAAASPFAAGVTPQAIAVADFNGDGNPDIVTANNAGNTVSILLGNGAGGFAPSAGSPFAVGVSPGSVAVGDFNGDGKPDIVTSNSGGNNVSVLLGDGAGGFTPAAGSPFAAGKAPFAVGVADFNGDGKLDIVTANNVDQNLTILLGNGTGGFTPSSSSPFALGTVSPQSLAVGDFNGDGVPDVAVTAYNNKVVVLLGDGSGGFRGAQSFTVGSFPQFIAAADLNADGRLDIVTANSGGNTVSVLLGNGTGGFTAAPGSPFAVGMTPQSVAVADVNGDGKPDLLAANSGDNTVTVLLGNGSGGFIAASGSPFAAGSVPLALAVGQFNGDGRTSIAIADVAAGSVTLLLGGQASTGSSLTTTVAASIAYGTPVPLTLKVSQPSGGFNSPTGSVTFLDSGMPLGTAAQTASPWTFTAVGLTPGNHPITATYGGDNSNGASTSNTLLVTVMAASQTITFGALANKTFGSAPFNVTATASSGLAVSFVSTTLPVCTVSGASVTLVTVGTCTIQASQPGNANYAAAPSVNHNFTVLQGSQTITFNPLPNQAIGSVPPALSATASSGLPVNFTSTTLPVCTVSGSTLTALAAGTCTVQATQPGDAEYTAAPSVSQHFSITPMGQTITFGSLTDQVFGTPAFMVSATASSGLAVTFTSTTAPVCTISGGNVTLVGVGTCTIQAAQAGNTSFGAAPSVSQSFKVTQASQTISFAALANTAFGSGRFTVAATATSALAVTFASTTATICTVSGVSVTLVAVGSCTVEATQAGNANYAAAVPVDQSFMVTPASQRITFAALTNKAFGAATITVTATASSALTVSFASLTPSVCTVSGAAVTLVSAGTCTIEASQPGNANFGPAMPVDQSFMVTQGSQTITFAAVSNQPFGSPPLMLSPTASSGLPVTLASTTTPVCTVSGFAVTLVTLGTCTVQATQPGNADYAAAMSLSQSFKVTQGTQTITFAALLNQPFGTLPFTTQRDRVHRSGRKFSPPPPCPFVRYRESPLPSSAPALALSCATQPGNTNYMAAPSVNQSFMVAQASQTITFDPLANQSQGAPAFTLSATASSGLPVSFCIEHHRDLARLPGSPSRL